MKKDWSDVAFDSDGEVDVEETRCLGTIATFPLIHRRREHTPKS